MRRNERKLTDIGLIEEIIQKADVCRIALVNNDIPYIVTMNFGYKSTPERTLYFHCAKEGRKLDMIALNNYVCFEMDIDHELNKGAGACDWGMKYKSIIGYGYISIVSDEDTRKEGLNHIMRHYGAEGDLNYDERVLARTLVLRLDIKEITGKKC